MESIHLIADSESQNENSMKSPVELNNVPLAQDIKEVSLCCIRTNRFLSVEYDSGLI